MNFKDRPAEEQLKETQDCLRVIYMMLDKYANNSPAVTPFSSPADLARYFKFMIEVLLPEEDE